MKTFITRISDFVGHVLAHCLLPEANNVYEIGNLIAHHSIQLKKDLLGNIQTVTFTSWIAATTEPIQ